MSLLYKRTEQAHIEIAVHALSSQDPGRFALDLISVVLGEGMSSRLFLELREKRALCYDVHSYASHYLDAGAFAVYAGVDPKKAAEAVDALLHELARMRDDGITDEELHKANELPKGRLQPLFTGGEGHLPPSPSPAPRARRARSICPWVGADWLMRSTSSRGHPRGSCRT